jgi:eukaryotic-like serine/threonine-protein kinase
MSAAPSINDVNDFAVLAVRSGLISKERLSALISESRETERNTGVGVGELAALVELLTSRGILTPWQCQKLREGKFKGFLLDQYRLLDHLRDDDSYNYYLALNTASRERLVLRIHQPKGWWFGKIRYDVDDGLSE